MKKQRLLPRLAILLLLSSFTFTNNAYSQFEQVGDILKAGQADANKFLEAYLTPVGRAWGYDLGGGWYNSPATHKTLGFDVTFSMNFATVPEIDMSFDINELGLEKITSATAGNEFPTVTNGNEDDFNSIEITETLTRTVDLPGGGEQTFSEEYQVLPPTDIKGFDIPVISGIPLPTLNAGIGIIKNTELVARFIPTVGIGDFGNIGLWGIGVKHDILQWIPVVKKFPFLKASAFAGYTTMNLGIDIPYTPPEVDDPAGYENPENQRFESTLSAFHGALLVGAKLPVVTPYLSLGITKSQFDMNVLGEFALPKPQTVYDQNDVPTGIETTLDADDDQYTLQDPVSISISNKLNPSVGAGVRVKLAVITLYGQYTVQEYPMISGGLGVSFR